MDITSPITLWKDYDVTALPLNTSALSEKTENGITVKEFYFDGYTTVDGRVRTFIKILEHPDSKGVALYLADRNGDSNDELVSVLYDNGYTVAVLDYLGRSDKARYTLYPRSLAACNLFGVNTFEVTESSQLSNWYIWTCIARRAVNLLCERYPDKKTVAIGVGLGGNTVYKLAAFNDGLSACATLLNIIPNVVGEGNSLINYQASLSSSAYSPFCKVPLFMAVASNDKDSSLDDMAELAENTESLKHLRILERSFAAGIKNAYDDLNKFLTARINGLTDDPHPTITPSNSENNLYFNIDVSDAEGLTENATLKLFVSFCIEDPTFRNWMQMSTISLGNNKYMAKINVCQSDKPIHAFANLILEDGRVLSSEVLGIMPKSLGIKARPGVSHRKIYDFSMGYDVWTSKNGGKISLVKGPFDIEGVSCETNSLITFKPGDPLFHVPADTLLKIMVCGKPQLLNVKVSNKTESYTAQVEIKNENEWTQVSLSHMNFKGHAGTLQAWTDILMLEFDSDLPFIVGSVLWI